MTLAYGGNGTPILGGSGVFTTQDLTCTAPAGSYLVVAVNYSDSTTNPLTSVKYDPAGANLSMTLIGHVNSGNVNGTGIGVYALDNIPGGTKTVRSTASGSRIMESNYAYLTGGVGSAVSPAQTTTGNSTTPSHAVTVTSGNLCLVFQGNKGGASNSTQGTFLPSGANKWNGQWNYNGGTGYYCPMSIALLTANDTVSCVLPASDRWVSIAVEFTPVAAQNISAGGISSAEALGAAVVAGGDVNITAAGIPSAEAFGAATIHAEGDIQATGIPSAEVFGGATVAPGARDIPAGGIPSAEAFGGATVAGLFSVTTDAVSAGDHQTATSGSTGTTCNDSISIGLYATAVDVSVNGVHQSVSSYSNFTRSVTIGGVPAVLLSIGDLASADGWVEKWGLVGNDVVKMRGTTQPIVVNEYYTANPATNYPHLQCVARSYNNCVKMQGYGCAGNSGTPYIGTGVFGVSTIPSGVGHMATSAMGSNVFLSCSDTPVYYYAEWGSLYHAGEAPFFGSGPNCPPAGTVLYEAMLVQEKLITSGTTAAMTAVTDPGYWVSISTDLSPGLMVAPGGIASGEAFGAANVFAPGPDQSIAAAAIASAEALGSAIVTHSDATVAAAAIPSGEALGNMVVIPGAVNVTAAGIPSGEVLGTAIVAAGAVFITPAGIPSAETHGSSTIAPGAVNVSATGIPTAEAFGGGTVTQPGGQSITPTGIPSAQSFGSPSVTQPPMYVWYLGGANERVITGAEWTELIGSSSYPDTEWGPWNGWAARQSAFTAEQLAILAEHPRFEINKVSPDQPDIPRTLGQAIALRSNR